MHANSTVWCWPSCGTVKGRFAERAGLLRGKPCAISLPRIQGEVEELLTVAALYIVQVQLVSPLSNFDVLATVR